MRLLAVLLVVASGLVTAVGSLRVLDGGRAAAAPSPCNYSVTAGTGTTVNVAGNAFVTNVTAGSTVIKVDCNTSASPYAAAEASLLAAIGTTGVSQTNEGDTGALATFTASGTDTGCPAATAGQCSIASFAVPATFAAGDANAKCGPPATQVNDGLFGCAIAVVNSGLSPIGAQLLVMYGNQTAPGAPTIASAQTSGVAGENITISDAAGATSWWWAGGLQAAQAAVLGTTPLAAPASCGPPPGYGDVPTGTTPDFFSVEWIPNGGGSTIVGSDAGIQLSNLCYNGTSIYQPTMGGTLTVPAGVVTGQAYTVWVCELDAIPTAGGGLPASNDAAVGTHCATPTLANATWIDASFQFTIEAAASATATPSIGGVGTLVTVQVTGINPLGTPVLVELQNGTNGSPIIPSGVFTTNPNGSNGSCGSIGANGSVTCTVPVGSGDTIGPNNIAVYQANTTVPFKIYATFTVSAISTSCTASGGPPPQCAIQQLIAVHVTGGSLSLSEAASSVTLAGVTLNGQVQTATGNLNQVTVTDDRGTNIGWTVVAQFFGPDFSNATPVGQAQNNNIDVGNFAWTPSVAAVSSYASQVAAGPATSLPAVPVPYGTTSTTSQYTFCTGGGGAGANGGGGGVTTCNAAVRLLVPSSMMAGTYSDTLQITVS